MEFDKKDEEMENNEDTSSVTSLGGSYISDTLTLNGVKCDLNDLLKLKNSTDELMVIGKSIQSRETPRTENDQDQENEDNTTELSYDVNTDEIFGNFRQELESKEPQVDEDLATLEQLKEQKNLLKSIRLRKEELKALEGRRLALEALKKMANDSEAEIEQAFAVKCAGMKVSHSMGGFDKAVVVSKETRAARSIDASVAGNEREEDGGDKMKQVADLCNFLQLLKEKQVGCIFNWQIGMC